MEVSLPPEETPGYDPQELVSGTSELILLQENSPEHAARVARELLRQCNQEFAVAPYPGTPPPDRPAIIFSPADPPVGWIPTAGGYFTHAWGGPPQLWVKNLGHVYRDTDPLVSDLCSYLPPQRERPLPFPDANYELVAREGETPAGEATVEGYWSGPYVTRKLDLSGGVAELSLGQTKVSISATEDQQNKNILRLGVSATRPDPVEISVTLPAGWWLVYARDMKGGWDRVADPVSEERLPDGRIRVNYSLHTSDDPFDATFDLARLKVRTTPT